MTALAPSFSIPHVFHRDDKAIAKILAQTRFLQELDRIIKLHLDENLAAHCQVANLHLSCLFFITDNAVWATQLRFQAPLLITHLKQHPLLYDLKQIRVQVIPPVSMAPPPSRTVPKLDHSTAEAVLEIAKTISHAKLRSILEKIAAHKKETPSS